MVSLEEQHVGRNRLEIHSGITDGCDVEDVELRVDSWIRTREITDVQDTRKIAS